MSEPTLEAPKEQFEAPITINIGNICGGTLPDAFELALEKVLANIYDMQTPATAKRSITLKVDFKPSEDRIEINTTFNCDTHLATYSTQKLGRVFVAQDGEGKLYALAKDPRQRYLFEPPKVELPQTPVIQFATGTK